MVSGPKTASSTAARSSTEPSCRAVAVSSARPRAVVTRWLTPSEGSHQPGDRGQDLSSPTSALGDDRAAIDDWDARGELVGLV
jgi:hypothetical protein